MFLLRQALHGKKLRLVWKAKATSAAGTADTYSEAEVAASRIVSPPLSVPPAAQLHSDMLEMLKQMGHFQSSLESLGQHMCQVQQDIVSQGTSLCSTVSQIDSIPSTGEHSVMGGGAAPVHCIELPSYYHDLVYCGSEVGRRPQVFLALYPHHKLWTKLWLEGFPRHISPNERQFLNALMNEVEADWNDTMSSLLIDAHGTYHRCFSPEVAPDWLTPISYETYVGDMVRLGCTKGVAV